VRIRPRAEWGAKPPENVTLADPKKWKGIVVHWFGSPRAVRRPDQVAGQLRGVQRSHMNGEFSDVAYNFGVDQWGRVWELRGLRRRTGANGTTRANREMCAVVVMIGAGDKPTPTALASLRALIGWLRTNGVGRQVVPHGSITGSECPGPHLRQWIGARAYEPARPVRKPVRADPLAEAERLIVESAAYKRRHPRIVRALERLRAFRRGK
jgi:hypothetical protein